MRRTSIVGGVRVLSSQLSSVILVGDSVAVTPRSLALAVVQPGLQYWDENAEDQIDTYRTFEQSIPVPSLAEAWSLTVRNDSPSIQVGLMDIKALAVSAVLQIGSNRLIDTENRTKFVYRI